MTSARLALAALTALVTLAVLGLTPSAAPRVAAPAGLQLVRGFHFGGGGFGSRPVPRFTRRPPSRARTILRHVARAAAFAAFFHFLFAGSHGLGFLFLLILVVGLVVLVSRARRRRSYAPPPRW